MIQLVTDMAVDTVVERLKAAIAHHAVGLVAHINGQANAAKRGLQVSADQILEIFRPDYAVKVWAADKTAGLDIPLRLHVYAQDTHTVVAYRLPSVIFSPYKNPILDLIGREWDDLFDAIVGDALAVTAPI